MISQSAAIGSHEVESTKLPDAASTGSRASVKREADDPAVVIAVGGAAAAAFEGYRVSASAAGASKAPKEPDQAGAIASESTRGVQAPPAPAPAASKPVVAAVDESRLGAHATLGGAPAPTSTTGLSSVPARAGQRTASMDPASPAFEKLARAPAPPPAPSALPSPIGVEAPQSAKDVREVVKEAVARPPDAEGPPNRQVSSVQVELAGAAAVQSAQPAAQPVAPAKKAQKPVEDVSGAEQSKPVEQAQANARRVGEIKEMMEYMRYEQDRSKVEPAAPQRSAAQEEGN